MRWNVGSLRLARPRQADVQRHEVGLRQRLLERARTRSSAGAASGPLRAAPSSRAGCSRRTRRPGTAGRVAEHVHVEADRLLDEALADAAGADHGDRRAASPRRPARDAYGCQVDQVCSRTICSDGQVLRATAPMMRNANSAVASVSTSGVWLKGIRWRLAAARSMLSTPTASWATSFRPAAAPAAKHLVVDPVAQRRDQGVDPARDLLQDERRAAAARRAS